MSWKILDRKEIFKTGFFSLWKDKCEMTDGRIMPGYFVMGFSDWVNIVPITKDGQMVMVEQYRHAAEGRFLELPGGTTHPGQNEDPKLAAQRELLEETGYESKNVEFVASHYPNPALQTNQMHVFIAWDCLKVSELNLDPYEELEVKLVPVRDVYQLLEQGKIGHSLMVASLALARPQLKKFF